MILLGLLLHRHCIDYSQDTRSQDAATYTQYSCNKPIDRSLVNSYVHGKTQQHYTLFTMADVCIWCCGVDTQKQHPCVHNICTQFPLTLHRKSPRTNMHATTCTTASTAMPGCPTILLPLLRMNRASSTKQLLPKVCTRMWMWHRGDCLWVARCSNIASALGDAHHTYAVVVNAHTECLAVHSTPLCVVYPCFSVIIFHMLHHMLHHHPPSPPPPTHNRIA